MERWSSLNHLLRAYAAILVLSVAMLLPALTGPELTHDSFRIDWVWAEQFNALLREGVLYPRWLPQSHGGLGAPVFYFYPPVGFYLSGLLGLAGLGTYASLIGAFGVALAASGVAMYHWLSGWTRWPLAGALLYMIAPYHVFDFLWRGALAEFCAFAVLPLLAIGLRRATRGKGVGGLALAYALLILTHLPSALLASVLFVAPWLVIGVWRSRSIPRAEIAGLALGIALSGIYLVPMLTLQQHVSIAALIANPHFQAGSWSLLAPERWASTPGMLMTSSFSAATAFAALIVTIFRRDSWAFGALAVCALALGLVPGFWSLPLIVNVQFPWRALLIAQFFVVTALAAGRLRPVVGAIAVLPMLAISAVLFQPAESGEEGFPADWRKHRLDVAEYLPAGSQEVTGWFAEWPIALAARQPELAETQDGRTVARVFAFPAWQVECEGRPVATSRESQTGLLSWRGSNCTRKLRMTSAEQIGLAMSLLAALILAILAAALRRHNVARLRVS